MRFHPIVKILLLVALLCQCTPVETSQQQAEPAKAEQRSPYTLPAAAYVAMAKNQQGSEQQSLLLMAAGQSITQGDWTQAGQIVSQIKDPDPKQSQELSLYQAELALHQGQVKTALINASNITSPKSLTIWHQIQYHQLLAKAYLRQKQYLNSVRERIKLEALLTGHKAQHQNLQLLWSGLMSLEAAELQTQAVEAKPGSELQGWLQLALLARQSNQASTKTLTALQAWREDYPDHPGNQVLPESLSAIAKQMQDRPRQVALILPLSGPLSGPGEAIRDGFLAENKKQNHPLDIKLYDSNQLTGKIAYQQAIDAGVDYVVGPLTKTDVAEVAQLPHPVPTLLLNELNQAAGDNAYQFGLSPQWEARQVADMLGQKGLHRVLLIVPAGSWGDDIRQAFVSALASNQGRVVDQLRYDPNLDLNAAIAALLKVDRSQQREKILKQWLGQHLQTVQSRRQDFDAIFLVAYPSKARQIMPLLKYYFAGDVPVFATSSIYSGTADAKRDKDLDGILFCDIPGVFAQPGRQKNWPEQFNSYNRLYALGQDSFGLLGHLNGLRIFKAIAMENSKGMIAINQQGQVAQALKWGQFRQGLAQPLEQLG